MKKYLTLLTVLGVTMASAADAVVAPATKVEAHNWNLGSLVSALGFTAVFAIFGTLLAILCYKIFDWATPGKLHEEILEKKNVAAAILGGAIIIGVSLLVGVSMLPA